MKRFAIRVADMPFEVCARYCDVRDMCADYLTQEGGGEAVQVTQRDIDAERARAAEGEAYADSYLETLVVLRKLAEILPLHRRILMHGAVLEYNGRAYMFCAPSGTGKSTHVALWLKYLGKQVRILNGDKPFVQVFSKGPSADAPDFEKAPLVFGTPWAGKEGWQCNACAPLAGICFLSRARSGENAMRRIAAQNAVGLMAKHVHLPERADAAIATLELMDDLLACVPLFALKCDMSEDAVRVSFEGLTGESFQECAPIA